MKKQKKATGSQLYFLELLNLKANNLNLSLDSLISGSNRIQVQQTQNTYRCWLDRARWWGTKWRPARTAVFLIDI